MRLYYCGRSSKLKQPTSRLLIRQYVPAQFMTINKILINSGNILINANINRNAHSHKIPCLIFCARYTFKSEKKFIKHCNVIIYESIIDLGRKKNLHIILYVFFVAGKFS